MSKKTANYETADPHFRIISYIQRQLETRRLIKHYPILLN